ncbi:hypothetical protein CQ13_13425 [Bradyrhizobium retamae]|uniref:Uncharacterized protein n=2 Tax=Bradyrhizobium retamae TaxID=1300035 RepID=A0A0R3MF56_9BRAD|nr:hypothetical protein CQ13_13425 [Bradyrhizobium retamae]
MVDGLLIDVWNNDSQSLNRIEEALRLIKHRDALHYSRVVSNLDRIWVLLLPDAAAHYDRSQNACVMDERFVLLESTTLERIASTIVHEATHARLERWGMLYDEKKRPRIEAICLRRELNFLAGLPDSEPLQEEIKSTLEWCAGDHDFFSDENFQQREEQGQFETLRYLGTPNWLINFLMRLVQRRRERWLRATSAGK